MCMCVMLPCGDYSVCGVSVVWFVCVCMYGGMVYMYYVVWCGGCGVYGVRCVSVWYGVCVRGSV